MAQRIVFRTEAGPEIGGGHAMRCLALAEAVRARGWEPVFAASEETFATAPALARAGLARLPPEPAPAAVAVLDGYRIASAEERAWGALGASVAVVDDALRPHQADLWVDPTPGRNVADYRPFAGSALTLSGPAYAPMKSDFARLRPTTLERRAKAAQVRRVLVNFGMTDPEGASLKAVAALARFPGLEVDVVAGRVAASLPALRKLSRVRVHVDAANMAELTAAADLGIGAPGVSSWERCALGLPSVALIVADNQRPNARALVEAGAARVLGDAGDVDEDVLAAALSELLEGGERLRTMSWAAATLSDGRGAERVADALLKLLSPSQRPQARP